MNSDVFGAIAAILLFFSPLIWKIFKFLFFIMMGPCEDESELVRTSAQKTRSYSSFSSAASYSTKPATPSGSSANASSGAVTASTSVSASAPASVGFSATGKRIKDPDTGKRVRHGEWVIIGPIFEYVPKMRNNPPKEIVLIDKLAQKYAQLGTYDALVTKAHFSFGQPDGAWSTTHCKELISVINFRDGVLDGICRNYKDGRPADIVSYKNGQQHGIDLQIGWDGEITAINHYLTGKAVGLSYRYDYGKNLIIVHNHDTDETRSFALDINLVGSDDINLRTIDYDAYGRYVFFRHLAAGDSRYIEISTDEDGFELETFGKMHALGIAELKTLNQIQRADTQYKIDQKVIELNKTGIWPCYKSELGLADDKVYCGSRFYSHDDKCIDLVRICNLIPTAHSKSHVKSYIQYSMLTYKKHGPSYLYTKEESDAEYQGKLYAYKEYKNGELHGISSSFHFDLGFVHFTHYERNTPLQTQVIDTRNKRLITLERASDNWADMSPKKKAKCPNVELDLPTFAEVLQPVLMTPQKAIQESQRITQAQERKGINDTRPSPNPSKEPVSVQAYTDDFTLHAIRDMERADRLFSIDSVDLCGYTHSATGKFTPAMCIVLDKLSAFQGRHRDLPPVRLKLETAKEGFWQYMFPDKPNEHWVYLNTEENHKVYHVATLRGESIDCASYCQFSKDTELLNGPSYYFDSDNKLYSYKEYKDDKLHGLVIDYHLHDNYVIVKQYSNDLLISPEQRVDIKLQQVFTLKSKDSSWERFTSLTAAKGRYTQKACPPDFYDKIMEPTSVTAYEVGKKLNPYFTKLNQMSCFKRNNSK